MRKMLFTLLVGAMSSPVLAVPMVSCDGTESTGTGDTSCPAGDPRDYAYPVAETGALLVDDITDVYIGTEDCRAENYTNICMPPGWTFAVVPNPPPLPFLPLGIPSLPDSPRPELWQSAGPKTDHTFGSPGPVPASRCAIHWSDGGTGGGLPSNAFKFGFDHPIASIDVDWEVIFVTGLFHSTWNPLGLPTPVGLGLGPVHSPKGTRVSCDGTESGGAGPRLYSYPTEDPNGDMTDLYIGTADCRLSNYTSWLEPAGWTHVVTKTNPRALTHDRGKTAHGGTSFGPTGTCFCMIHWSGPAGLPGGAFTFGFDNENPSHDVEWQTVDGKGTDVTDWNLPVGWGFGPVHAPTKESGPQQRFVCFPKPLFGKSYNVLGYTFENSSKNLTFEAPFVPVKVTGRTCTRYTIPFGPDRLTIVYRFQQARSRRLSHVLKSLEKPGDWGWTFYKPFATSELLGNGAQGVEEEEMIVCQPGDEAGDERFCLNPLNPNEFDCELFDIDCRAFCVGGSRDTLVCDCPGGTCTAKESVCDGGSRDTLACVHDCPDGGTCTGGSEYFLSDEEKEDSLPGARDFEDAIPTVSQWGLVVMMLLVLAAGTIVIIRRRAVTA